MKASAVTARATLRQRIRDNRREAGIRRLKASTLRRPRSLTTHVLAAGIDTDTARGVAGSLRTVAKRLGIKPEQTTRSRRSAQGGRPRHGHRVYRYTRSQVQTITAAYKPRKAEYRSAAGVLALALAA